MKGNRGMFNKLVPGALVLLVGLATTRLRGAEYQVVRAFEITAEPACMPAATRAPNGDVLVAFSTEWEPIPAGGVLKLVVSKDKGATWSKPRALWKDDDPRVTIQVANGMQKLSNGEILLPVLYATTPRRKGVAPGERRPLVVYETDPNHPEYRREVRLLRSPDNGQTWHREDPKLPGPTGSFGRLLETRDGRLLRAGYWVGSAWYHESRDYGKTWSPRLMLHERFSSETNIVEAADGALFVIVRGAGGPPRRTFGTSFSRDGGKTWSSPRSARVQGKMPDLLVLPCGRILMVLGAEGLTDGSQIAAKRDRYSFCTLFVSDDHGQTWKRDLALEQVDSGGSVVPGDGPGLVALDDGKILVVIQALDRARAGHPLFGFSAGMSIIGNIIEPTRRPR